MNLRMIVDLSTTTEQEMLKWLAVLRRLTVPEDVILRGTKVERLLSLRFGAGQNNDVAAHSSSKLDGQMTETSNAHDTNTISWTNAILRENSPDSGASAHQRSSMFGCVAFRDRVDTTLVPDGTVAECTVVMIVGSVFLAV